MRQISVAGILKKNISQKRREEVGRLRKRKTLKNSSFAHLVKQNMLNNLVLAQSSLIQLHIIVLYAFDNNNRQIYLSSAMIGDRVANDEARV